VLLDRWCGRLSDRLQAGLGRERLSRITVAGHRLVKAPLAALILE
jgi:hypothetical protein